MMWHFFFSFTNYYHMKNLQNVNSESEKFPKVIAIKVTGEQISS